jgi:hypothetical protein
MPLPGCCGPGIAIFFIVSGGESRIRSAAKGPTRWAEAVVSSCWMQHTHKTPHLVHSGNSNLTVRDVRCSAPSPSLAGRSHGAAAQEIGCVVQEIDLRTISCTTHPINYSVFGWSSTSSSPVGVDWRRRMRPSRRKFGKVCCALVAGRTMRGPESVRARSAPPSL